MGLGALGLGLELASGSGWNFLGFRKLKRLGSIRGSQSMAFESLKAAFDGKLPKSLNPKP